MERILISQNVLFFAKCDTPGQSLQNYSFYKYLEAFAEKLSFCQSRPQ